MKVLAALAVTLIQAAPAVAQQELPVIRSNVPVMSIRDGDQLRPNGWRLDSKLKPDVYEALLPGGVPRRVTFITDVDSIAFLVEAGKHSEFNVLYRDTLHWQRVVGIRLDPAAVFDSAFQAAHRGQTRVMVPEVYELVNVALALTPAVRGDPGLVHAASPYHADVQRWFARHASHPAIARLDSALKADPRSYASLRMNGYAFEFDSRGRIVRNAVYDRTGPANERANALLPFIEQLQRFADASGFRRFYREHRAAYAAREAFFRDTAGVAQAQAWLDRNFAPRAPFQLVTLVVSPLVGDSQSVTVLQSNGFTELQPHFGYPYAERLAAGDVRGLSPEAVALYRRNAPAARMQRSYIGTETGKYSERILWAVSNRKHWVDPARGPGHYPGSSAFHEYLTWGLVALRLAEQAPEAERAGIVATADSLMVARGFPRFPAFSRHLVPLWRDRPSGQTVADLFPAIISWFEDNNGW